MNEHICECGREHCEHHRDHGGFEVSGEDAAPAVASFEHTFPIGDQTPEAVAAKWESVLLEIEKWCDEQNAFIGHIKLALSSGDTAILLSCTGNGAQRLGCGLAFDAGTDSYRVKLAAIVYYVEEETLSNCLERFF